METDQTRLRDTGLMPHKALHKVNRKGASIIPIKQLQDYYHYY